VGSGPLGLVLTPVDGLALESCHRLARDHPAWHRQGFQLYWRWKSKPRPVGRPKLDAELRHLIHRMARDNPTWGRRRIQAELAHLGYHVAERTVTKYMCRAPRSSSTWRAFLTAPRRGSAKAHGGGEDLEDP
jgi:hypothetical protein